MRTNLLFSVLLLACAGGSAWAQTVSESEAYQRAASFYNSQSRHAKGQGEEELSLQLAYTSANGSETYYYVFNNAETDGFVIVSGNECAPAEILAYSNNGLFDYEQIPDNFKWWLSQYDATIHAAIEQGGKHAAARPKAASAKHDIPELLKTKWSQSTPYNNAIPQYTSSEFVTGCVATAMGQVMKYHNYPTKGQGSHTSQSANNGGRVYSANFGNTTYDWANMLDEYDYGYNDAQANAVATLLYHAGVSVDMTYGTSSGAFSCAIPHALTTYFGYDPSAEYLERTYYTDEEWLDIIYNELDNGRPVLYGGQDAYGGGGHQFVCHGYRASDQKFAINWGWAGYCDGYCTLIGKDGLKPGGSGTGGAGMNASYSKEQDIVINVMPNHGGKAPLGITTSSPAFYDQNGDRADVANINLQDGVKTMRYQFKVQNLTQISRTVETCVMLKEITSGACIYTEDTDQASPSCISLATGSYSLSNQTIYIKSTDFEYDGIYEAYLAIREKGTTDWQLLRVDASFTTPLITVNGGTPAPTETKDVTFEISSNTVEERATIQITHDKLYGGKVTYSSSPEGIVSIDANGVVTGVKAGSTRITVQGEEAVYFNATTAYFDVTVTPYVKKPVEFAIGSTQIRIDRTTQITCTTSNYTGTLTYETSDSDIATVDANGLVTGVALGTATITVRASEDDLYRATTETFTVTVTGFDVVLEGYSMKNQGFFLPDEVEITVTFRNISDQTFSEYHWIYAEFSISGFSVTDGHASRPWYENSTKTFIFNESEYVQYFANRVGKVGVITIKDNNCEEILSDPIPFRICNPLEITYTMSSAEWGTICLPFEAEVPAGLTAYSVVGVDGDELQLEAVDFMEMNTPYLLNGTAGSYTFDGPDTTPYFDSPFADGLLRGNTKASTDASPVYAPADSYVLQNKNGVLGFYKVKESQKIKQYSAYIVLDEATATAAQYSALRIGSRPEAIGEIASEEMQEGNAYSLQGHRIDGQNRKGLVISNGKVSFIK